MTFWQLILCELVLHRSHRCVSAAETHINNDSAFARFCENATPAHEDLSSVDPSHLREGLDIHLLLRLCCQDRIRVNLVHILRFGRLGISVWELQGQTVSVSNCHQYVNERQCQTSTISWCTHPLLFHRSSLPRWGVPHTLVYTSHGASPPNVTEKDSGPWRKHQQNGVGISCVLVITLISDEYFHEHFQKVHSFLLPNEMALCVYKHWQTKNFLCFNDNSSPSVLCYILLQGRVGQ